VGRDLGHKQQLGRYHQIDNETKQKAQSRSCSEEGTVKVNWKTEREFFKRMTPEKLGKERQCKGKDIHWV
jgi:hypothetical protein